MTTLEVSDAEIVGKVLSGRDDAFGLLVDRYLPLLHAFAYARTGNHEDAEDAVQETLLQAYRSLDKLREPARLAPWLFGIARHVCARVRLARARRQRLTDALDHAEPVQLTDMARRELHQLIRSHIQELDEDQREVLVMHYYSGAKIHEIAEALDISSEAAAKRLQRARAALGERLLAEIAPAIEPAKPAEERKAHAMAAIAALGALPKDARAAPALPVSPVGLLRDIGKVVATHHRLVIWVAVTVAVAIGVAYLSRQLVATLEELAPVPAPATSNQAPAPPATPEGAKTFTVRKAAPSNAQEPRVSSPAAERGATAKGLEATPPTKGPANAK